MRGSPLDIEVTALILLVCGDEQRGAAKPECYAGETTCVTADAIGRSLAQ
jgi:hypothetical protein